MQHARAPESSPFDRIAVADALRGICRTAESDAAASDSDLFALVDAVAERGVAPGEGRLDIASRTAVRLVERGLPWVARDVIRHHLARRPLFTDTSRDGRVFAWLAGFQDPRVGVPDDVYDISDRIVLRGAVDEVRWTHGTCVIAGSAHFSHLVAEPDDQVVLVLRRPGGMTMRFTARRTTRPDRVVGVRAYGARLAWSGFCAEIDGDLLLDDPATGTLEAELRRAALVRTARLSPSAAVGLASVLPFDLPVRRGQVVRLGIDAGGALTFAPSIRTSTIRLVRRRAFG